MEGPNGRPKIINSNFYNLNYFNYFQKIYSQLVFQFVCVKVKIVKVNILKELFFFQRGHVKLNTALSSMKARMRSYSKCWTFLKSNKVKTEKAENFSRKTHKIRSPLLCSGSSKMK